MSYLLALDQGTTSCRALLFTERGEVAGTAQREFEQHFPRPGWVEHDPADIWESQLATAREVLAGSGAPLSEVAAIGLTNQRETTIVWERLTGMPIHSAIVWQDRRTADFTDRLKGEGLEPMVRAKTGLMLDPYFSAAKIGWILDEVEGARARGERGELCFGTVDSYLIYKLTGGRLHATDVTNASRTLLFNIHDMCWDPELLELFNVPEPMLPRVLPSTASFGDCISELFGGGIAINGVAGDQQAALFGQGCLEPGMAKSTYGTGGFAVMNTGGRPVLADGLLTTVGYQLEGSEPVYALEGSIFIAGAAVQWLRDGLGLIGDAKEVEELARSVEDNGGVYFVPAFVGLGSPHWNPHARGVIAGLTRGATRGHLARAALEAICYQVMDVIKTMSGSGEIELAELRVDGGAVANDLLMQFQADMLTAPVVRPAVTETTALGAALFAGVGSSVIDTSCITELWREESRFLPSMSEETRAGLVGGWSRCVELAKRWGEFD